MLFDLRSPHRRRVIKVVYVFLAVLIGGGLIFFGIGNGSNFGGLLTAAGGGGGTAVGEKQYVKALATAEKRVKASPNDASLWLKVGEASYSLAILPDNYLSTSGFTKAGHVALNEMRTAWNRYLALSAAHPNLLFAQEVVAAFGSPPSGVGDYKTAGTAQLVVTAAQPNTSNYEELAYYAWLSGDDSQGDLAAARARTIAGKANLAQVDDTLEEMASAAASTIGVSSIPGAIPASTGATGAASSGSTASAGTTGSRGSTGG
jgi:hypothetical protein